MNASLSDSVSKITSGLYIMAAFVFVLALLSVVAGWAIGGKERRKRKLTMHVVWSVGMLLFALIALPRLFAPDTVVAPSSQLRGADSVPARERPSPNTVDATRLALRHPAPQMPRQPEIEGPMAEAELREWKKRNEESMKILEASTPEL